MVNKNFIFLCGVPRSGTTAFAEILNLHDSIAIGIERFKSLVTRADTNDQFTPDLFEKERFFDFRDIDTNVRADDIYRRMQSRYDSTSWVGDKVPRYYTKFKNIYERFPDPLVFFITRDVHSVALSWNDRAANPEDSWPIENNYEKAVVEWNRANAIALRQARDGRPNFHIISYSELLPYGIDLMAKIIWMMNLELNQSFLTRYKNYISAPRRPSKAKVEYPNQAEYVSEHADMDIYNELLSRRLTV